MVMLVMLVILVMLVMQVMMVMLVMMVIQVMLVVFHTDIGGNIDVNLLYFTYPVILVSW